VASLITVAIITTATFGVVFGAFLTISLAMAREDRRKWSLRSKATTSSRQTARRLVGIAPSGIGRGAA
jgi:hypothetical protein